MNRLSLLRATAAHCLLALVGSAVAADSSLPKSRTLLEQRVVELKDEARQKATLRTDLAKLADQVKSAQQCAASLRAAPSTELEKLGANLRSAWRRLVESKPATVLDSGHPEYEGLERAFAELQSAANIGEKCLESIPGRQFSDIDRLLRNEASRSSPLVGELISQYIKPTNRTSVRLQGEGVSAFLFRFQSEGRTRAQLSAAQIEAIGRDIENQIKSASDQSNQVAQLNTALKQLADATEREANLNRQRLDEIDKSITELDDRLSTGSAATDRQLIMAVYMMIGALLVLFLGIKFLSNDIAMKIVENRSLVEVVSMAFLLLTIIILGTGEKMPKDAIGTLLGSIAGYIFGRKISDAK